MRALTTSLALATLLLSGVANAKPSSHPAIITCDEHGCSDRLQSAALEPVTRTKKGTKRTPKTRIAYETETAATILPHPSGCPTRAFCGCGASIRVFGHSIRSLWLARNWFEFPQTYAKPGAVAVRRHHVMVIEQVVGDNSALVYDANSGGHRTRLHVVSLAGYSIRDPHGHGRLALN